jgi:hypothetical protein
MILPRSWHLFFRSPPISFCFLWLGQKKASGGWKKKTQPANWIQAVLCTKSAARAECVCVLPAIMALARLSLFQECVYGAVPSSNGPACLSLLTINPMSAAPLFACHAVNDGLAPYQRVSAVINSSRARSQWAK